MGRKRKLPAKSAQSAQVEEPPLKQQHQFDLEAVYEEVEEEVEEEIEEEPQEEVEQEEEQENEEEEEEEDEEEEEEDNHAQNANDQTVKAPSTSAPTVNDVEDDEDEPIQKLLEPFGKDEIARLLCDAASKHRDVAERIRKVADSDPSHRKIFVHGLGWDTTAETLTAAFGQYGEIEDCKAVCDKISGKSKGYGFILFKSRRGARLALREPQKKIGNRMTACQLASIGPVQQPNNLAGVGVPMAQPNFVTTAPPGAVEFTQRKIYVSNVGSELDPQRLLAFFSRFGEIEDGPLGLDKLTGKPKGFCLFVYKSAESAKRALEEPHKEFEGHILHCQKAIDGPKRFGMQQQYPPLQQHHQNNAQRATVAAATTTATQFQRNGNPGFVGGVAAATPGHLMAPAGPAIGYNQGGAAAAAAQALNPALGQALTALLASQGAGLGLTGLLGTLGSQAAVNPAGHGMQGGYGSQANVNSGAIGGYGNQVGLQSAYPNQQVGQGGSGRGQQQQQQHGVGQYGGVAPYMGH
ncbi:UBP1-associated protein 2A-like [Gastrolobium bilobum]|uniref:UBP1-associated protein 2A-like n=1 Tax=Gastrolobium bilobum TaxID=150636 RepID=UPI002AB210DE|nr:UBP1-associated protein 2A-like [Gastrolobium bilobum]